MNRTQKLIRDQLWELMRSLDLPSSITIQDVERTGDTDTEGKPSVPEGQDSSNTETGSTHQNDRDGDGSHA